MEGLKSLDPGVMEWWSGGVVEYLGSKMDVSLLLFSALCRPHEKQISFHQTQYSNTPLLQCPHGVHLRQSQTSLT